MKTVQTDIPNKPTVSKYAPGTILARNRDTGVEYRIRPDMLKMERHPWIVLEEMEELPTIESLGDNVILTQKKEPFKNLTAAKITMRVKKLSEDEYKIVSVAEGGHVIVKVSP